MPAIYIEPVGSANTAVIPVHRPSFFDDEEAAIREVLDSRWVGTGRVCDRFEARLREFLGAGHVLCVNSGTAALHLAMEVLGLPEESEVLVPSITFPSTVQAIVLAGLRPRFCEVDPDTMNICTDDLSSRLNERTRAILPVHYGGFSCDMDSVNSIADAHGLRVVEDAAHAFGSSHRGRMVGTMSDMACFSFDALKNVTTIDGGAVATDNDDTAHRLRILRNIGIDPKSVNASERGPSWKYEIVDIGYRYVMADINASIGLVQLNRLATVIARKRDMISRYLEVLSGLDEVRLLDQPLEESAPFSFVIRVIRGRRDALREYLKQHDIGSAVEFVPNHLQPAFREFHEPLPMSERLFTEILTLPLHCELTDNDVEFVAHTVKSFFASNRRI